MEKTITITKEGILESFEKEKAKIKIPLIIGAVLLLLLLADIAAFPVLFDSDSIALMCIAALFPLFAIAGIIICIVSAVQTRKRAMEKFENAAACYALERTFFSIEYQAYNSMSKTMTENVSKVFPFGFNRFQTTKRAVAIYGRTKTEINAATFYLVRVVPSGESGMPTEVYDTIFQGLWFVFELEKKPDFELGISSQNVLDKFIKPKTLKTGNEEFDKRFIVSSPDSEKALAFLSGKVSDFLLEKTKNIRKEFYFYISKDGHLHVALEADSRLFNLNGKKFDLEEKTNEALERIRFFTDIADEFIRYFQ